ncbi:MAG: hypothetical protein GY898_21845 [Proteobacteria bacterium]|nr:hypothetical protein [Pseudomonadota bacterium]
MSLPRLALLILAAALLVPAAAQAGMKIELGFDRPAPADELVGSVTVTFEDARDPDKGGEDPSLIGNYRSTVGIPWGLYIKRGSVKEVVSALVADALRAAGLKAKPGAAGDGARVHVRLDNLWCDGHTRYEMRLNATLQYFPPGADEPTWTGDVVGKGGVTAVLGVPKEFSEGYARMFQFALERLAGDLKDSEFRTAVGLP